MAYEVMKTMKIGRTTFYHVTEAAKLLNCSERTIYRRIKRGGIGRRFANSWYLTESELKNFNVRTGNYGNKKGEDDGRK